MKVFAEHRNEKTTEGGFGMIHAHRGSGRDIPQHERRRLMPVEFDEADLIILKAIFGDEDTAAAALEIIREAPPEIRILAFQLIDIIEEVV